LVFLDFLNDGDTPEKPVHRLVAMIPLAMVLFAVAYNFYSLYPEVGIQVLARTTVCCTWLPLIGRHRLYMVVTTGYFGLVGSELSFRGEKKGLYPAASAWLTSGLPGVKQHPSSSSKGNPGKQSRPSCSPMPNT
jgi:hypothetical protein